MKISRDFVKELYGKTVEDAVEKATGFDEIDNYFDSVERIKEEADSKIQAIQNDYDLLKATLDLKETKLQEAQKLIAKHLIDRPVENNIDKNTNPIIPGKITNEDIIRIARENNDLK